MLLILNRFSVITLLLLCSFYANMEAQTTICPSGSSTPTVLIAGDSWAQYMWDDNAHNIVFDKYGHADKDMLSQSLGSDPGAGYTGSEYAISGSEARQWADQANYPWIANVVAELNANPSIKTVVLSIGGNDILAAKSGGGWYKDMDLDVAGSEEALFATIEANTLTVINAFLAVRPDIEVIVSSYDYPNFNTGLLCFAYACPKRQDLSRDPTNDLMTDADLNQMMIGVEQRRLDFTKTLPRVHYDNSLGLMHHFYGDGISASGVLPRPGIEAPNYLPFPAGNNLRPALRENFRNTADPIHLDADGYLYKVAQQTDSYFFDEFRGEPTMTIPSEGGANDGWSTGNASGTDGIYMGDSGNRSYKGIVSFNTANIPDNAVITEASLYFIRSTGTGNNPFTSTLLGSPTMDVVTGTFGTAEVERGDATEPATATDVGCFHGTVSANDYALRIDLNAAGLAALNTTGLTQFRLYFPLDDAVEDAIVFFDGDEVVLLQGENNGENERMAPIVHRGLVDYMGGAAPFMDVKFTVPLAIDLNKFTAQAIQKTAVLDWITTSEENSEAFDIERLGADNEWMKIGTESAKGEHQTMTNYQFIDNNPSTGKNYYRLKMIDRDGSFEYSETRVVYFKTNATPIKIFPNPFESQISIEVSADIDERFNLRLVNILGQTVSEEVFTTSDIGKQRFTWTLDANLSKGTYFLRVQNGDVLETISVVKH